MNAEDSQRNGESFPLFAVFSGSGTAAFKKTALAGVMIRSGGVFVFN